MRAVFDLVMVVVLFRKCLPEGRRLGELASVGAFSVINGVLER
jgi:hypothetical protein